MKNIRSAQRSLPHPKGSRTMSPLEANLRKPVAGGRQEEDKDNPESSSGSITLVGNLPATEGGNSSKERRDDRP